MSVTSRVKRLNHLPGPRDWIVRLALDSEFTRAEPLSDFRIAGAEDPIAERGEGAEVDITAPRLLTVVEAVKLDTSVPAAKRTRVRIYVGVLHQKLDCREEGEGSCHVLREAEEYEWKRTRRHLDHLVDRVLQDSIHSVHARDTVVDGVETPEQGHVVARGVGEGDSEIENEERGQHLDGERQRIRPGVLGNRCRAHV